MPSLSLDDFPYQKHYIPGPSDIMWIFTGEWSLLDNFAPTPVVIGGVYFATSEHAFAWRKAADPKDAERIRLALDPGMAKALGRRVPLAADWEKVKFDWMRYVVQMKLDQNPSVRGKLRLTQDRVIVEGNTWQDDIWGMVESAPSNVPYARKAWEGRNALGLILMWERERLRRELLLSRAPRPPKPPET